VKRTNCTKRRGKVIGAVVSLPDLAVLTQVRGLEDQEDRAAVARAWRAKGSIAWALIKRDTAFFAVILSPDARGALKVARNRAAFCCHPEGRRPEAGIWFVKH
jgi:hypothetical protein